VAYNKFKELTGNFNFNKRIPVDQLPDSIKRYVEDDEKVWLCYKVYNDEIIFTNKKIVILDTKGILKAIKKVHALPYCHISSAAIDFGFSSIAIHLSMDSGYQLKLNFVSLTEEAKDEMNDIYINMMKKISNG